MLSSNRRWWFASSRVHDPYRDDHAVAENEENRRHVQWKESLHAVLRQGNVSSDDAKQTHRHDHEVHSLEGKNLFFSALLLFDDLRHIDPFIRKPGVGEFAGLDLSFSSSQGSYCWKVER